MSKVKVVALFLAAAGVFGAARSVRADQITAKLTGLDPFAAGSMVLDGVALPSNDGVGELEWDGTGANPPNEAPFNGPFTTFCIDLNEDVNFNNDYTFTLDTDLASAPKATAYVPPQNPATGMGQVRANEMRELFGSHFAGLSTGDDLQAFQLAIWDIVYGSDADSVTDTSSTFYVAGGIDSNALSEANAWLTEASNPANLALHDEDQLIALIGQNGAQDQVVIDNDITISTGLPLPSAGIGGAVLLAGLGLVRLNKARRVAAL